MSDAGRNFTVELSVDGLMRVLRVSPRSKRGGYRALVKVRDQMVYLIEGQVIVTGQLVTTVYGANGQIVDRRVD